MKVPVRYRLHIQPLFNEEQRGCMLGYIDLWSYEDVKLNAEAIFDRIEDKSMPADDTGPWPEEWVILLRRWIDEGCQN